jgi:hypothetical protein
MSNNVGNNYKGGISLIVLIITIVVSLILVVTTLIITTTTIDDANVTMFAKNLNEVEQATEAYYIANTVIPTLSGSSIMNKDELLSISTYPNLILDEIIENSDLDSQFYTVDLNKINVTKTKFGNKELGENDIFVIAFPSMNAYYPIGIDARGTTYFSITSKISKVKKISQTLVDTSATSVISSGGMKVTKNNGWANKMGVTIEAKMAADELLYMSVSESGNRLITTTVGTNTFGFDLLTSIVSNTETIKVPTLTTLEANYIEAGTKPLAERYVDILKYKGSEIIAKIRIDLSNYSKKAPTITSASLSAYPTINTVKLLLASSESGIREVRYEYLTRYTDDGTIENYTYNVSDFDSAYMLSKSKKAGSIKDLTTTINAPKDVQSIKIAIIDNAGNVSLYNQEIASRLYIGYSIDIATTESVQLTAKMYSINGIKSIKFSKSLDGINFTDEQLYTLNTTTNGVTTKQSLLYLNIPNTSIYIKMEAINYNSTITETRVIKVKLFTPLIPVVYDPIMTALNFGRTSTFGILAGTTITNTGITVVNGDAGGDIGLFPGTSFTGMGTVTASGAIHINDGVATNTKNDLVTIYDQISVLTPQTLISVELGGTTLKSGIYYTPSTFAITGTLTLDAENDPNAVFIFKTPTTLITAAASNINLINGAKSCRVLWQVGSSATLGASSNFSGRIFAFTTITVGAGANIKGQLLARNGAVTLDTNTITNYIYQ